MVIRRHSTAKLMFRCGTGVLLLALLSGGALAEILLIAHPGVPADEIEPAQVQRMFLGKVKLWKGGEPIKPAMLGRGPETDEFLKIWIKKTPARFSAYWKKAVFTGKGTPPRACKTAVEMIAYVAATPGAIGYVEAKTLAACDSVKVLSMPRQDP